MLADMFTMIGIVALDQQYAADKSYLLNENRLSAKELKNDYVKLEKIVIRETEE